MFRKSLAFILLGITAGSAAYTQTPEPRAEKAPQAFAFEFSGSYLGVETGEVTKENFSKLGLREVRGVAVEKVMDGSPAQTAGLQSGDVILKFNGEEVTSVRKLTRMIGEVAPDHQARVLVLRGGSERELTVTLGKRPMPKFESGVFGPMTPGRLSRPNFPPMAPMPDMPNLPPMTEAPLFRQFPGDDRDVFVFRSIGGRRIGISVTGLTKQLSDHYGVDGGVIINNVRENSPAAKAGLKAGDIIVEVEGKQIKNDVDLIRSIGEKKEGSVTLTIVRGGNRQTIPVTPEEVKGDLNTFFEFPDAPDAPAAPGKFKFATPAEPPTPMPLNQLLVPGRVI
jgi:serine protease Do